MAMTTTGNPADVANRLQTYFSKKLLEHAKHTLRLSEFGMKGELPANSGSKTIRFFRKREADSSQVGKLTEGVAIATFTEAALTYVDATLIQVGEATKISDVLQMIDIFPALKMNIESMGEDCALKCDDMCRNAIVSNAAIAAHGLIGTETTLYNSNGLSERFAGVSNTLNSATDFGAFNSLSAANAKITRARALGCVTQLATKKAPKINGKYVGLISPEVKHDFMQDGDVLAAFQQSTPDRLWKGQLGDVDGVTYVEATNPFREGATYGTYSASGANFTTLFLGKDAFGVPKLGGTASPWSPSVNILNKADKSDPANQFALAVWKAFYTAILLNANFVVAFRSKSTFA